MEPRTDCHPPFQRSVPGATLTIEPATEAQARIARYFYRGSGEEAAIDLQNQLARLPHQFADVLTFDNSVSSVTAVL
jgi:hypothetical protein